MSAYVGRHASHLPGSKACAPLTPGKWCIWTWKRVYRCWWRWKGPRRSTEWTGRKRAEAHYQRCIRDMHPDERYALIDGAGVVQAYAAKEEEK